MYVVAFLTHPFYYNLIIGFCIAAGMCTGVPDMRRMKGMPASANLIFLIHQTSFLCKHNFVLPHCS